MSARPLPAQVPGTRASLTPLLGLSEKEARIAKERELGIYKEHKVGAPLQGPERTPLGCAGSLLPADGRPLPWVVPLEAQDGWGLLGGPWAEGSAGHPGARVSGEGERPQPVLTA